MTRKSFKSAVRTEPLEFEVSTGEVFTARARMAAGPMLKFAASIGSEDDNGNVNVGEMSKSLLAFLSAALIPEDRDRFKAMIDDPEIGIPLDELTDIAGWLANTYSARPTGTDSESTSPKSPTGPDSMDGALPAVTTYSRPDPTLVESAT